MASDRDRIKSKIKDLEGIRKELIRHAASKRSEADKVAGRRNSPPNPTRAYEHQRECDAKARQLRSDADSATREAERLVNEIRGLERSL